MSVVHLGFYNTSASRTHVRFQFSTHEAAGGNVAPSTAFEAADLRIYKAADGAAFSATQRSSANGITMTSPFDSLTGVHDVDIDLTDNSDASFYASGGFYSVVLSPDETVDGQTITGVVLAYFEIGTPVVQAASLGTQAKADVNAEVVDCLNVDTYAEPGQEAPPATTTLVKKIGYSYKIARNRKTQTATQFSLFADNGTTVDQKATVSDDSTTFDFGELATGP